MATYDKKEFTTGKWADKAELYDTRTSQAKIVSETNPETSTFKNEDGSPQMQDVCKVQFAGYDEALKVSLNRATINALVDAFGGPSSGWQGHPLSVEIDKLPGKKFPLYLIPEGYRRIEDENGYSVIIKKDAGASDHLPSINI
jgi:hypothetical protein